MGKIEVLNITLKRTTNIAVISVLFVAMMMTFSIPSLTDKVQAKIDAKGNSIDGPFTNIVGKELQFPNRDDPCNNPFNCQLIPDYDDLCKNPLICDLPSEYRDVCGLFAETCEVNPTPPTSPPPTGSPDICETAAAALCESWDDHFPDDWLPTNP